MTNHNTLDFAKFYIAQGWQILPLAVKGKKPLIPWMNGGSTDLNVAAGWFDNWHNCNIGIVTGKRSGIVVLDVDKSHNGDNSLLALIDKYGVLPETPMAHTGGGGLHYVFAYPEIVLPNSAGKLGEGLDIRGDGGQICAAPSVHATGNIYKWDTEYKPSKYKPAPMPQWLLDMIITIKETKAENVYTEGMIPDGQRHDYFVSLAGSMRKRGMSGAAINQALIVENKIRCVNPVPDEHIQTIADDIEKRYTPDKNIMEKFVVSVQQPNNSNDGLDRLVETLDEPTRFIPTGLHNLDDKLGGLPAGYLVMLVARPGMGKTTLSFQIARNMATAGERVLFVSLEMTESELWLKAALGVAEVSWKDYFTGEVPAGTKQRLQDEIIPTLKANLGGRLFIYDKDQDSTTTDTIDMIIKQIQPTQVIVDHLAYVKDEHENEIKRLGLICRRLRSISKQGDKVGMLVLHHANRSTDDRKNQTKEPRMSDIRGSGEIEQAADIILMPYIPSNYDMAEEKPRVSLMYMPVVKNRIGQVGIHLVLYFDGLGQWFYRKNELPMHLTGRDQ